MSVDLSKAIGYQLQDQPVAWTKKDLLLYAVGIGAKKDDLPFVYELDKSFAAFPTFPVVLNLKGQSTDVTDFNKLVQDSEPVPGLPKFDPRRIVHGSQSIESLKPLPTESGGDWKLKRRIIGIHENKSGVIVEVETLLVDGNGVPYSRMVSATFNVGGKATGQKFSRVIAVAPSPQAVPNERTPDHVVTEATSEEQAIIYRLSGDFNPLHIDPRPGQKAGFGGAILHGLSTFGFAARAVLKAVGNNDPTALLAFGARFTSPVKPGDSLETSTWRMSESVDGVIEVAFLTKNLTSGKVSMIGDEVMRPS
ncbi:hypothetical protein M407DRAFT_230779 [Tulasnella calospora MUT 4182]|uniref:Uncharacterized protein n=1 Tax=Tulasnella calospora MUT 4182 TaxID=1051891 RepID=A0A0C3QL60_9AGAM|nr:hypothetical protein M407DRAFT_230779 [Tulasnella calospora MUT 4182]